MKVLKNTLPRFGLVAISFHWVVALLIVINLILGFSIASLPPAGEELLTTRLIFIHKEIGVSVLTLVAFRLIWRLFNVVPELEAHIPAWQKIGARTVHVALYGFMFALPLSGWAMSSAAGFPVSYFGLFDLPFIVAHNKEKAQLLLEIHKWLAIALIATLVLHIGAALYHHFIDRDNTLRKMLPWG